MYSSITLNRSRKSEQQRKKQQSDHEKEKEIKRNIELLKEEERKKTEDEFYEEEDYFSSLGIDALTESKPSSAMSVSKLKHLQNILNVDKEFDLLYRDFVYTFTDQLKTKKTKRYAFEDYDYDGTMDPQEYHNIIAQSNTFITFKMRGRSYDCIRLKENTRNQNTKYSNFSVGIAVILKNICEHLLRINQPYRQLKMTVESDNFIENLVGILNNYAIAFPVKQMFFSQGDDHHYLYILPGYDVLELDVPILIPGLSTYEFTTNTCLNLFFTKDAFFYTHEKVSICQLINRCTIIPNTSQEIKEAPLKLIKVVTLMCNKVKRIFSSSEKTIFALFMRRRLEKKILYRIAKRKEMVRKFKIWARAFSKEAIIMNKSIIKLTTWIRRIIVARNIITHSMILRFEKQLQRNRILSKAVLKKLAIIRHNSLYNEENELNRFIFNPVWYASTERYLKTTNTNIDFEKIKAESVSKISGLNKVIEVKVASTGRLWHGFNNNASLKNLIIGVGETEDILGINITSKTDANYLRVKSCIGKICQITKSRQYIKFCRSLYGNKKASKNESLSDFHKCFGNTEKFDKSDVLKEVCLFSSICGNKWYLYVVNNINNFNFV